VLELNLFSYISVGKAAMTNTDKAQEGAIGSLVVANISGETSVGILQDRGSH
jgi:hypothetical protein